MTDSNTDIAGGQSNGPTLATPEPSENQYIDYEGPMNIFYVFECHLKTVNVYSNKAVICRTVRPQIQKGLTSLVVFKRLPSSVDHSSFRLEVNNSKSEDPPDCVRFACDTSQRPACIQDVTYHATQPGEAEREMLERRHQLRREWLKASRRYQILQTRFQRLTKQQTVLESLADSLITSRTSRGASRGQHNANGGRDSDGSCSESSSPSGGSEDEGRGASERERRKGKQSTGRQRRTGSRVLPWRSRSLSRHRSTRADQVDTKLSRHGMYPGQLKSSGIMIPNESLQLSHIEAMRHFFTLYNTQTQQLDEDAASVGEELTLCRTDVDQLELQLNQLSICHDQMTSKELHVLLESKSNVSPELELTYTVNRVSWAPSYDIRLSSSTATLKVIYYGIVTQKTGENWELGELTLSTAQPSQSGRVPELGQERLSLKDQSGPIPELRPRSGVDKRRRRIKARSFYADEYLESGNLLSAIDERDDIFLDQTRDNVFSTSMYSERTNSDTTGSLGMAQDWFARSNSIAKSKSKTKRNNSNHEQDIISQLERTRSQTLASHHLSNPFCFNPTMSNDELLMIPTQSSSDTFTTAHSTKRSQRNGEEGTICLPLSPPKASTSADASSCFSSLTFNVTPPIPMIRGTGEPQRVTLGLLEFRPTLEYVTIPKLLPKAFLRVRMHNTSEYALLEGPASVYIDNCFNGKIRVSATAVQEELQCDLGIDPGVQVTYKPRHKYKKTGSFLGQKTMSITFTQVIGLCNSYGRSLQILVIDQLPLSTDEKLKVQLIEPTIKHLDKYDPSKPVRINKDKMVEWDVKLGPYENRELVLKYLVEHPILKDLNLAPSRT